MTIHNILSYERLRNILMLMYLLANIIHPELHLIITNQLH